MSTFDKAVSIPFLGVGWLVGVLVRAVNVAKAAVRTGYDVALEVSE